MDDDSDNDDMLDLTTLEHECRPIIDDLPNSIYKKLVGRDNRLKRLVFEELNSNFDDRGFLAQKITRFDDWKFRMKSLLVETVVSLATSNELRRFLKSSSYEYFVRRDYAYSNILYAALKAEKNMGVVLEHGDVPLNAFFEPVFRNRRMAPIMHFVGSKKMYDKLVDSFEERVKNRKLAHSLRKKFHQGADKNQMPPFLTSFVEKDEYVLQALLTNYLTTHDINEYINGKPLISYAPSFLLQEMMIRHGAELEGESKRSFGTLDLKVKYEISRNEDIKHDEDFFMFSPQRREAKRSNHIKMPLKKNCGSFSLDQDIFGICYAVSIITLFRNEFDILNKLTEIKNPHPRLQELILFLAAEYNFKRVCAPYIPRYMVSTVISKKKRAKLRKAGLFGQPYFPGTHKGGNVTALLMFSLRVIQKFSNIPVKLEYADEVLHTQEKMLGRFMNHMKDFQKTKNGILAIFTRCCMIMTEDVIGSIIDFAQAHKLFVKGFLLSFKEDERHAKAHVLNLANCENGIYECNSWGEKCNKLTKKSSLLFNKKLSLLHLLLSF